MGRGGVRGSFDSNLLHSLYSGGRGLVDGAWEWADVFFLFIYLITVALGGVCILMTRDGCINTYAANPISTIR